MAGQIIMPSITIMSKNSGFDGYLFSNRILQQQVNSCV